MERRHDLDALRALAFAVLILYHWAMLYVADWDWHLKSPHTAEWLQLPMLLVNRWRMPLLFLLSGIATCLLLGRTGAARFLGRRSWRLLLPLAFGMLVVVPVQPYAQGVANGMVEPGFWDFLIRYYRFEPWPAGSFDGDEEGVTWNHLWYLAYLWAYTAALVLALPLLRSTWGRRLRDAFTALRGWRLLLLPAIPFVAWTFALQPHFEPTGDLVHDWYRNALYFTAFLYGYWLGVDDGLWAELARLRRRATACALAIFAPYAAMVFLLPDEVHPVVQGIAWTLRNVYLWIALCAVLGWSKALLDRPFRWLPWANESVYPWYVLHQSLTVALAFWLLPRGLPVAVEALLVLAGTVAGCWMLTAVVRRVPPLRPLFGLPARRSPHGRDAARAPVPAGWTPLRPGQ